MPLESNRISNQPIAEMDKATHQSPLLANPTPPITEYETSVTQCSSFTPNILTLPCR